MDPVKLGRITRRDVRGGLLFTFTLTYSVSSHSGSSDGSAFYVLAAMLPGSAIKTEPSIIVGQRCLFPRSSTTMPGLGHRTKREAG